MTDAAREARNAYMREWYRKNKDKARAHTLKYWEKKAMQASGAETDKDETKE